MTALLEVHDLSVHHEASPDIAIVRGVSMRLASGECLGLVGESGSGKSLTCQAIMGLLPRGVRATGRITFRDRELDVSDPSAFGPLRGRGFGMIFQEPRRSLNPVRPVGRQLHDAVGHHQVTAKADVGTEVTALLRRVGFSNPARIEQAFPHELSGGECQRVMIAMALAGRPALLFADEPTTALDVTVQAEIAGLLDELRSSGGMGIVWVSHDIELIAENSDRLAVMYAGSIVEVGPSSLVVGRPAHPYAAALVDAVPDFDLPSKPLRAIEGLAPPPAERGLGCAFVARCPVRLPVCEATLPSYVTDPAGRAAACHRL